MNTSTPRARVFPSDWKLIPAEGLVGREADALQILANGLGEGYTVYHGIHWTRLEQGLTVLGRIQFLVLTPSGMLVLIAMKTGVVRVENGRLYKSQLQPKQQSLPLSQQLQKDFNRVDILEDLLEQGSGLARQFFSQHQKILRFEPLLYFPDFKVRVLDGVALQARRVVDASANPGLCDIIREINEATLNASSSSGGVDAKEMHRFLSNSLDLVPEVGALSEASEHWLTRLTQGLEDWVGRLKFEPFKLRVQGTAGSGKSQLALKEMVQNHRAKARTLYVCYNRPLAAHMAGEVRGLDLMGATVFNFHALCDRVLRDAGQHVDFSQAGAFDSLVSRTKALPIDRRWIFDSIVIDEGQDFEAEWLEVLKRFGHERTRWIWLEDPAQNLYAKAAVQLPGWVTLQVPLNYRNPQRIVEALQAYQPAFGLLDDAEFKVQAMCPLEGFPVEYIGYEESQGPLDATAKAITGCLKQGFSRNQIALLTLRGHEKSRVLKEKQLGPHALRHFTGQYDEQGNPVFTEGAVLAESVYRFKGQSAQAVVVTEVEFETFSDSDYRKLFVAMTRAKMLVVLVGESSVLAKLKAGTSQIQ